MASTDAKPYPKRGEAYRITFPILDADGDLVTGAAGLDSEISQDGGTFVDCTNEATEIAASSGMYYLDLTANEMNCDTVSLIIKTSTSGAKTTPIVLYPVENGDIPVNVRQWAGTTTLPSLGDMRAQINASLLGHEPMKTSTSGRFLDVSAAGEAGLDWGNIGSPDTVISLGGTTIRGSGMVTDAVTGAVGSVTGNVGGNVTGSVGSVSQSGISPSSFGADVREQVASAMIKRGMVKDEGSLENRSLGWAISKLVNKLDMNASQTTLSIRKTDDSTALFTQALTTSGGALPVTAADTA